MRQIKYTSQFKRDYKRAKKSGQYRKLDDVLLSVVRQLSLDKTLPVSAYDHALTGNWFDHRDCHIKPDLLLVYRKPDPNVLELVRFGSHSQLGL